MKKPLDLDIETNGRSPWEGELLIVGLGNDEITDIYDVTGGGLDEVIQRLDDPEQPTVTHTGFDTRYGLLDDWKLPGPMYDTQVMAWVINENTPLDLDYVAKKYAGIEMDKRLKKVDNRMWFRADDGKHYALDEWRGWHDTEVWRQFMEYNRRDVETGWEVFQALDRELAYRGWTDYYYNEEVPFTSVLRYMESRGMQVDLEANAKLHERLLKDRTRLEKEFFAEVGYEFNLNSGDQLAEVLFKRFWHQKESIAIPGTLDLRKPALVDRIAGVSPPDIQTEGTGPATAPHDKSGHRTKKSVTNEEVAELKLSLVRSFLPETFEVGKIGQGYVHGTHLRRGFDLDPTPFPVHKDGTKGKRPGTSTPVLMYHHGDKDIVHKLLPYRKVNKILTTYTGPIAELTHEGRIYGRFNQTGTKTGRISSSAINLTNIPARPPYGEAVRELFTGELVIADESQLEPRIMASLSGDPTLVKIYNEGLDVYGVTGQGIFGYDVTKGMDERDISKTVFLGTQYGAMGKKLAMILALNGFPTAKDKADEYLAALRALYPRLYQWKDEVIASAHRFGYVTTMGGRRRRLKYQFKDPGNWRQIGYGERQAVNAKVQGTAADIMRKTMIEVDRELPLLRQLAQIHDELVLDHPDLTRRQAAEYLPTLKRIGEEAHGFDLKVPLLFEPNLALSWAEKGQTVDLSMLDDEELV